MLGTSTISVQGVDRLHGAKHRIIADRIEAGTYLIAGAITGGKLLLTDCITAHLTALVEKLRQAGVEIVEKDSYTIQVSASGRPEFCGHYH